MIKKEFSLYLDLMRFLAAVLVVINHSNHRLIIADPLPQLGHSAVMVFFLLSGFVIAFVTDTRESDPKSYSISRLARIYSVVPVALVVTLIADTIGQWLDPAFYQTVTTSDHAAVRFISSFFLLNEIWSISITTYSNVPYWSLNYEVWYYILFGMAVFLRGKTRLVVVSGICLMLGPKVLLLAPIWILGVYLYRSRHFGSLRETTGWILFSTSLILAWLFHAYGVREHLGGWLEQQIGSYYYTQLAYSKSFLSDYLLALIVFANFAGFQAICHRFHGALVPLAKPIKYLAGYTFVLYLTHQPLIWLFKTLIDGDPGGPLFLIQIWVLVAITVWLLGQITERRRTTYRNMAERICNSVLNIKARMMRLSGNG